jgi:hypothetical protein
VFEAREVNEIANLAFISGRTNRRISTDLPRAYLPRVVERDAAALASQCVPEDPALWELPAFPAFLEARRKKLAQVVNELVGSGAS